MCSQFYFSLSINFSVRVFNFVVDFISVLGNTPLSKLEYFSLFSFFRLGLIVEISSLNLSNILAFNIVLFSIFVSSILSIVNKLLNLKLITEKQYYILKEKTKKFYRINHKLCVWIKIDKISLWEIEVF